MKLNKLLKLGNSQLHETSQDVKKDELKSFRKIIDDLQQVILEYRSIYGQGRAVAAPQIGLKKRFICWNVEYPRVLFNPVLSELSADLMEVWDDCMSFPGLLVKVKRHQSCSLTFRDEKWNIQTWKLSGDLSELIQHEYDHLDGILATQRAIDNKSFRLLNQ